MAMIAYGLGILPLIRDLRTAHPRVTKTWYADDSRAGGTFKGIQQHLDELMVQGPPQGYLPEPTKSILVIYPQNVPSAEDLFHRKGLQIVMGSRYLGRFIGT